MRVHHLAVAALGAAFFMMACSSDSPTAAVGAPGAGLVFIDTAAGVVFRPAPGMSAAVVQRDTTVKYSGSASLRVNVPARTPSTNVFAGGAFVATSPRNLTRFNALTFYVRGSVTNSIQVGLGMDSTSLGLYAAMRYNIPVTTTWQKVVVPLPNAARLGAETGLFYLEAKALMGGPAQTMWFDEIQYEQLGTLSNVRADITSPAITHEVGTAQPLYTSSVVTAVSGVDVTVAAYPALFDWQSSNTAVATVASNGTSVSVVGVGTANVTAKLGALTATGTRQFSGALAPTTSPAAPTRAAAQVISLFSDAYTNIAISDWTGSGGATFADVTIAGNIVKRYRNFGDVGVYPVTPIDASTKTTLHIDVYVHDASTFAIALTDLGPDGLPLTGDDIEGGAIFRVGDLPPLTAGAWNSLDIPLSSFSGLTSRNKLWAVNFFGASPTTYIDNFYFY